MSDRYSEQDELKAIHKWRERTNKPYREKIEFERIIGRLRQLKKKKLKTRQEEIEQLDLETQLKGFNLIENN